MNLGIESLMNDKRKITITPYSGIGLIKLNSDRLSVRKALGDYKEFKKTKSAVNSTDDFKWCHVYYDKNDKCVAIEIFFENKEKLEVKLDGKDINASSFDDNVKHFQEKDGDCKVTKSELTSMKFGVIIGKSSVVVFAKEYIQKAATEALEALGIKKSYDYNASFNFNLYNKLINTSVRIITDNGIIMPDVYKTYTKVFTQITKYVDQVIANIDTNVLPETTDIKSKINYLTITIGKAPKGEHVSVGICVEKNEHIFECEFLNDKVIYTSIDG